MRRRAVGAAPASSGADATGTGAAAAGPSARLAGIPGFSIDRVAAAAGADPEVLRLENLDTDLPPPPAALEATRAALGTDEANSYLPFTGRGEMRRAVSEHLARVSGVEYDPDAQVVITAGGTEGLLDALLAIADPGDEVVLTDPTYAGMIQRVRLAGATPRPVPLFPGSGGWRLDLDALRAAIGPRTRALFLMSPSMPSGAVLDRREWEAVAEACREGGRWLLYNAAMERILFDGRTGVAPAALPGMAERTIVVGSASKELRMIGWRVGWVAGPRRIMDAVALAHIYNAVTVSGFAQAGAAAALRDDPAFPSCVAEWERRRDAVLAALRGWPVVGAAGGWSLLLDVAALGLGSEEASRRLLERGRVAATPMRHWGERQGDRFVRLVFSNEPVPRLAELAERVPRALG